MRNCPCCGYLTIDDSDEVITDICEVCFWQFDQVAQKTPDVVIGANKISLNEAKIILSYLAQLKKDLLIV